MKWLTALTVLVFAAQTATATAAVQVTAPDLVGSRVTDTEIIAADGWTGANGGFKISWKITFDGALWNYSYKFTDASDIPFSVGGKQVSHWLLEVSPIITTDNVDTLITNRDFSPLEGPMVWGPSNPQASNPGLPADIYAIKLDAGQTTYSFTSPQDPVWGDFYAKDGKEAGIDATAWNSGIGTDPDALTTDFTPWIPTPDSGFTPTEIPEPSSLLVWSLLSVVGLVLWRRRKRA